MEAVGGLCGGGLGGGSQPGPSPSDWAEASSCRDALSEPAATGSQNSFNRSTAALQAILMTVWDATSCSGFCNVSRRARAFRPRSAFPLSADHSCSTESKNDVQAVISNASVPAGMHQLQPAKICVSRTGANAPFRADTAAMKGSSLVFKPHAGSSGPSQGLVCRLATCKSRDRRHQLGCYWRKTARTQRRRKQTEASRDHSALESGCPQSQTRGWPGRVQSWRRAQAQCYNPIVNGPETTQHSKRAPETVLYLGASAAHRRGVRSPPPTPVVCLGTLVSTVTYSAHRGILPATASRIVLNQPISVWLHSCPCASPFWPTEGLLWRIDAMQYTAMRATIYIWQGVRNMARGKGAPAAPPASAKLDIQQRSIFVVTVLHSSTVAISLADHIVGR